jgi:hypothetical protein
MDHALVDALLARLKAARAKEHLARLLADIRHTQQLTNRDLGITGTVEDLEGHARKALENGWLSEKQLSVVVDEVEENGGQHVWLFQLSTAGKKALMAAALKKSLAEPPANPTAALYAELPKLTRTFVQERADSIAVKQIYKADYWEKDDTRSVSGADERVTYYVRKERRAINLMRILPEAGLAEIRIDRVRGQNDESLAVQLLKSFTESIDDLDLPEHFIPVPIWQGFSAMVADEEKTYMSTDEGEDGSVQLRISNRREGAKGEDVRKHAAYKLGGAFARRSLNVYWVQADKSKIHTILSKVAVDGTELAKVYVAAKLSKAELEGVIGTIRTFVPAAP